MPEKINGSHLVFSMDGSFDQHFLSGISGKSNEFDGCQTVRNIGSSTGCRGVITETTGDITTLTNSAAIHWGPSTFDSDQIIDTSRPTLPHFPPSNDDTSSTSSSDSESLVGELDQDVNTHDFGRTYVSGLR